MADQPGENSSKLVSYSVEIGGSPIKDTYQVKKISIQKEINRIPFANIELIDGNVAEENFEISESDDFKPGVEIEIKAGYETSENEETIFKGLVIKHAIKISCEETLLKLECKDEAVKLTKNRVNGYFESMTDSDIITQVMSDNYGGTATVEATSVEHERVVQYYATNWDFVVSRAELNGQFVIVSDGEISIAPPEVDGSAVLEIKYGDDIQQFDGEINAESQYTSAQGTAWAIADQDVVQSASEDPSVPEQGNLDSSTLAGVLSVDTINLQSGGPIEADQLTSWANGLMLKSWLSKVKGDMTIQGNAQALPGVIVSVEGVGDRFNGNLYLSKVEHTIESGDWKSNCHFGVSEEWFYENKNVPAPQASGMLPGISGLQIGKVLAYEEDPAGEIRIQVKVPLLQNEENTLWARLATMYATSEQAGTYFIPEENDEVILGFLNDDPRFPIVLGSVYSSTNTPPFDLSAENYSKAIITKGQCKITFDDEKKTIELVTPNQNMITITDDSDGSITIQDQTENVIKMSSSGVDITSKKGMTISVENDLSISAKGKVEISATGDADLSGSNVTVSAQTAAKVSGSGSTELSSSGNTTIKGTAVAIN